VDAITGNFYTIGDINELSYALATSLQETGVSINDVIAICSENRLDYLIVLLAVLYVGATLAPINPIYTKDELIHCCKIYQPKLVFATNVTLANIVQVKKSIKSIEEIIVLDDVPKVQDECLVKYSSLIKNKTRNLKIISGDPKSQIAVILSSSGTTGLPKGVKISHSNLLAYINNARDERISPIRKGRRLLGLVPFFHGYGYGMMLNLINRESEVIILPKFEETLFLGTIEKYKVEVLPMVPPLITFLAKSPLTEKYDLSSVKEIICGAAPCVESTMKEAVAKLNNAEVYHAYGMTETTILSTVCRSDSNKFPSIGKLVPGLCCKVVDLETGKALGPGKQGELCFKGQYIMQGYFGDNEATSNTIDTDGWLHSGDVGYYDNDHYFYIVDRIKELIKYKAFQVAPAELEALLLSHPEVKDAAVIGKPHFKDGEHPTAYIVKQPKSSVTEKELIDFVKGKVSPQKWLRGGIYFVENIPKNPSGKILRRFLRDKLKAKL
ncbi:hypothetical protein AAG570_008355, partial [Ranatra chinensis]